MADEVTIEQLVLRIAGVDERAARRLGHEVADALSERLRVGGITGDLHLARIHIRIPDDVPPEQLPGVIADRIWEAMT